MERQINIHKDMVYYKLYHTISDNIYNLIFYYQSKVKYGDNYLATMEQFDILLKEFDKLEMFLANSEDDFK